MVQYVNGMSCAINNDNKQLIINFEQSFPELGEQGFNNTNLVSESVVTIMMDLELVEKMHQVLSQVLKDIENGSFDE